MLSGPENIVTAVDRVAGYCRALRDAGIEVEDELIQYGQFHPQPGYDMATRMLRLRRRPTGVVTGNNLLAIGATKALLAAGVRVPQDMSVVTFDGAPPDLVVDPFFTMVEQPGFDMGARAARLLLDRLAGMVTECQEVLLPTRIVTYGSTAPVVTL